MATKKKRKPTTTKKPRAVKATRKKRKARRRELIEPTPGDRRYVRRDAKGQFDQVEDAGKSLAQDRRRKAKKKAKRGQGDRGDR